MAKNGAIFDKIAENEADFIITTLINIDCLNSNGSN